MGRIPLILYLFISQNILCFYEWSFQSPWEILSLMLDDQNKCVCINLPIVNSSIFFIWKKVQLYYISIHKICGVTCSNVVNPIYLSFPLHRVLDASTPSAFVGNMRCKCFTDTHIHIQARGQPNISTLGSSDHCITTYPVHSE